MLCGNRKNKRKALAHLNINMKILSQKYRFSNKELSQYTNEFKKMCQGRSSFTLSEFCENMGPLGLDSTRVISDRIFLVMNKSKTGLVSLQEYLEYMDILMHGTSLEKLSQSYKLITQDLTSHISYNQFESWIISLWKMYNILTGTEISATKEKIQNYFEKLDLKNDGVIDFEEFQQGLSKKENFGQWFEIVNQEISEKLKGVKERPGKSPNKNVGGIEKIRNEIKACISKLVEISSECARDLSRGSSPDILIDEDKLRIPLGDLDALHSFADYGRYKENDLQGELGKVASRLESVLSSLSSLDHDKENIIKPIIQKQKNSIRWGDNDWNLIMNMMIGIQKSVGSPIPSEISTAEFLSKSKHQLLPVKFTRNTYKFTDYAPIVFERLRKYYKVSNTDYTKSLGVEKIVQSLMANEFSSLSGQCSSGKSGSFFFYSEDGKFMLKTITISEYELLRKILPDYYFHMVNNKESLLTRLYGLYKITGTSPLYFVVMNSLFNTNCEIHQKFDLKGSTYGRKTEAGADKSIARKDLDFASKLRIGKERKKIVVSQIEQDLEFLQRLKIIDYSLLVGIHEVQDEIQCDINSSIMCRDSGGMLSTDGKELYFIGIIDFFTKFGAKKKIEHFVMGTLHGKTEVSCIPPLKYSKRFLNYIESIIE